MASPSDTYAYYQSPAQEAWNTSGLHLLEPKRIGLSHLRRLYSTPVEIGQAYGTFRLADSRDEQLLDICGRLQEGFGVLVDRFVPHVLRMIPDRLAEAVLVTTPKMQLF